MFNSFMKIAITEAKIAAELGEVPVGAVVVGPAGVLGQAAKRARSARPSSRRTSRGASSGARPTRSR